MQPEVQKKKSGRWIYVVGILLLCIVVLAGRFPGQGKWVRVLHDSGHGYVFAIVGVLCLLAWRRSHRADTPLAFVVAWAVAAWIGLMTEVAQLFVSRDASWGDVGMDAVGAAVGLSAFFAYERWRARKPGVVLAMLLAIIAAAVMLTPTFVMAGAYWQRHRAFPVIARFDQYYGRYFLTGDAVLLDVVRLPRKWAQREEYALRAEYWPSQWSILNFTDFVPDWRGYSTLVIDIVNPEPKKVRLSMRAHDQLHNKFFGDRFIGRFDLPPESRQQLRVSLDDIRTAPQSRDSNMSKMEHFGLFQSGGKEVTTLYVVRVWLE